MKKTFLFSLLLCVLVSACNIPASPTAGEPTAVSTAAAPVETQSLPTATDVPVTATAVSTISVDVLKNLTYQLDDFQIQAAFQDGSYSGVGQDGQSQLRGQLMEPFAFGDLNGDGLEDAVVILTLNGGGTGTFFYLVALLNQGGVPVQAAVASVGDRQVVNSLQIAEGKITLDFLTQGPNDGMCCPSQHKLRSYVLDNNTLRIETDQVVE